MTQTSQKSADAAIQSTQNSAGMRDGGALVTAKIPQCKHEFRYTGTDHRGSHKGEDAYNCPLCGKTEYRI